MGATIRPHERIQVEQSLKYSKREADKLWNYAGLTEIGRWTRGEEYGKSACISSSLRSWGGWARHLTRTVGLGMTSPTFSTTREPITKGMRRGQPQLLPEKPDIPVHVFGLKLDDCGDCP